MNYMGFYLLWSGNALFVASEDPFPHYSMDECRSAVDMRTLP